MPYATYPKLRALVIDRLKAYWSPEQISGRLISDGLSLFNICAETIYRFVYSKEDYGLGLYRYLPEARRKHRPRGARKPRNGSSRPVAGYRNAQNLFTIGPVSATGRAIF